MSEDQARKFQCCVTMYSSVEQAYSESSFSPNSETFDMLHDDTPERSYKQNKSTQQKQYRDREVNSFAELREAIREMTDDQEPPRTKYEILSQGEYTRVKFEPTKRFKP